MTPVQFSTATDDLLHGNAGKKSCFGVRDGRKFQIRYIEADVSFPIVSIGKASQQGNWFEIVKRCCQAGVEISHIMCEGPKCGKVGETSWSVLVAMFGNGSDGWSTVVPESQSGKAGR